MNGKTPLETINDNKTILDNEIPEQKHVEFTEDKQPALRANPWQELGGLKDRLSWAINPQKKPNMTGIQSWFDEKTDKHIIMLDYDIKTPEERGTTMQLSEYDINQIIIEDISKIQKHYNLSGAYLFKTGKGYHVYFLDIVPFLTAFNAIYESQADYWFKIYPFRKHLERCWTLRVSEKNGKLPLFVDKLHSNNDTYEKSKGHAMFLKSRGAFISADELDSMRPTEKGLLFCKYYQKVKK